MSYFIADGGKKYAIFGEGGVKKTAEEFKKEFLGEIPIDPEVGKEGDLGSPIVESLPNNNTSKIYIKCSKKFLVDFNILSVQRSLKIIVIFSRLFKRDKKNQYLKFIPYTWQLLKMRMNSEIFFELKKILDSNIPKKFRKKIIRK